VREAAEAEVDEAALEAAARLEDAERARILAALDRLTR